MKGGQRKRLLICIAQKVDQINTWRIEPEVKQEKKAQKTQNEIQEPPFYYQLTSIKNSSWAHKVSQFIQSRKESWRRGGRGKGEEGWKRSWEREALKAIEELPRLTKANEPVISRN